MVTLRIVALAMTAVGAAHSHGSPVATAVSSALVFHVRGAGPVVGEGVPVLQGRVVRHREDCRCHEPAAHAPMRDCVRRGCALYVSHLGRCIEPAPSPDLSHTRFTVSRWPLAPIDHCGERCNPAAYGAGDQHDQERRAAEAAGIAGEQGRGREGLRCCQQTHRSAGAAVHCTAREREVDDWVGIAVYNSGELYTFPRRRQRSRHGGPALVAGLVPLPGIIARTDARVPSRDG